MSSSRATRRRMRVEARGEVERRTRKKRLEIRGCQSLEMRERSRFWGPHLAKSKAQSLRHLAADPHRSFVPPPQRCSASLVVYIGELAPLRRAPSRVQACSRRRAQSSRAAALKACALRRSGGGGAPSSRRPPSVTSVHGVGEDFGLALRARCENACAVASEAHLSIVELDRVATARTLATVVSLVESSACA